MADVHSPERKNRVRLLKRIIVSMLVMAICLPTLLSVILLFRLLSLSHEVRELKQKMQQLELQLEKSAGQEQSKAGVPEQGDLQGVERSETTSLTGVADEREASAVQEVSDKKRKVYLTFDDGPSSNTDTILDILKHYQVEATFFVVAKENPVFDQTYRRIVEEGHTLGMHSYSHKYDEIYASAENYKEDLSRLQGFLYTKTGMVPGICRFPGGSSNTVSRTDMKELISFLNEEGITYFDWNVESGDTTSGNISADQIVENCISKVTQFNNSMILMHDAGDKDSTVEALPVLIEEILAMDDTEILPITDETIPIQHIRFDKIN